MKHLNIFIIAFCLFNLSSCKAQESIFLSYKAQTRGFIYSLIIENNTLEINKNNSIKKISLTKTQQLEIFNLLAEIDFKVLENNISVNDLAVDKAISGLYEINFKGKVYTYELDHNNLPKAIKELFEKLENYKE